MNVYDELDVINEFEDKFGNREAVLRSCDLMASYLAETTKPLPRLTTQAADVAIRYKKGLGSLAEVHAAREAIERFLKQRRGWSNHDDPDNCISVAVHGILVGYIDPSWGGGASELVSNFWDMMKMFDCDEGLLLRLLKQYFP